MLNVLFPTDFSENSQNAIKYALAYFSGVEVCFYILHVSGRPSLSNNAAQSTSYINYKEHTPNTETTALLQKEVNKCLRLTKNADHRFVPLLEHHNLVDAIRKHVAEKSIDYILMGTRGTSVTNTNEMGSNTCDVITKVKCPILVIPENAKFIGIKNVAFLTDYNCIYRNKIISRLSETLELHHSPLRVLHVRAQNTGLTPAQTDNKGFLHYFFKDKKHSFHFVENKELETGIKNFVNTWEISLVSIVAKDLNFIQRLLLRPVVKTLDYTSQVPFLVLHE